MFPERSQLHLFVWWFSLTHISTFTFCFSTRTLYRKRSRVSISCGHRRKFYVSWYIVPEFYDSIRHSRNPTKFVTKTTINILLSKIVTIIFLWKVIIRNRDHLNFISYKTRCEIMKWTRTAFVQYRSISRYEVYSLIGAVDYQGSWFIVTDKTATNLRLRISEFSFNIKPPLGSKNEENIGNKCGK